MGLRVPNANILVPILWLGCRKGSNTVPSGSGVLLNLDDQEYLVTASHVLQNCDQPGLVRMNSRWNPVNWETVVDDKDADIAILKTDTLFGVSKLPVRHGIQQDMRYGQIGYALGYPTALGSDGAAIVDHIAEVEGRPIPALALAIWNFQPDAEKALATSYINAGFSGGAIVIPTGNDEWTIVGVINGFPTLPRNAYLKGEKTELYVEQHTGMMVYTPMEKVEELVRSAPR